MDILIMAALFAVALLVYRGAKRGLIIGLWFLAVLATIALFRYHVSSPLDLSF